MTRSYSLRRRLIVGLLAALVVIAGVAIADSWREAQQTATQVSDRVLAGSVLAIAERVVVAEDGELEVDIPYVALEMLTSSAQDRVFYRVDGPDGFITGYEALPTVPLGDTEIEYGDSDFHDEPVRVVSLRRSASSGVSAIPFTVTVAETTMARRLLAQSLLLQASIRLAVLIAAAAAIVWVAVGLSLRPLYRLRTAITARSPSDLHPITQPAPREVEGLVESINSFMTRLASALNALRHFTGNASHQLRTPMAIVRTHLAIAQRTADPAAKAAAIAAADEAVAHAERILAQLLLLARIDEASSHPAQFAPINLAEVARLATAERVPSARAAGIDLGYDGLDRAFVRADAMLMSELIGNLISNVVAHAGAGAEATVEVRESPGVVLVSVADTGAGVAAGQIDQLGRRFSRQNRSKPGEGLGLAIVGEIAGLFCGEVALVSDQGRGFNVSVSLPAA